MIDKELIKKINELAKKEKNQKLSFEEKKLQLNLRKKYLKLFKENFKNRLKNIDFIYNDKKDVKK